MSIHVEKVAFELSLDLADKTFRECSPGTDLDAVEERLIEELEENISKEADRRADKVEKYCHNHQNEYLNKLWSNKKKDVIRSVVSLVKKRGKNELASLKKERRVTNYVDGNFKKDILDKITKNADELRGKKFSSDELDKEFDDIYHQEWEAISPSQKSDNSRLFDEVTSILHDHFPDNKPLLTRYLQMEPLRANLQGDVGLTDSVETVKLSHDDFSFSKAKKGETFHKEIFHAHQHIVNCFKTIDAHLSKLKTSNIRLLNRSHTREILMILDKTTRAEHKLDKSKRTYRFAPELVIRLSVHLYKYTIPVLQKIRDSCKGSVNQKLQTMKQSLLMYFRSLTIGDSGKMNRDNIIAYLICDPIRVSVTDYLERLMATKIVKEQKIFKTKGRIMKAILTDLAQTETYTHLRDYCDDPINYAKKWAAKYISHEYFEETDSNDTKYVRMLKSETEDILAIVQKNQINHSGEMLLKDWAEIFCDQPKIKQLKVTPDMFWIVSNIKVAGTDELNTRITKGLSDMKDNLLDHFNHLTPDNISLGSKLIHDELVDRVWGCTEMCPTCNEPCQHATEDHLALEQHHMCVGHRPQALKGIFCDSHDKYPPLNIETCSETKHKSKLIHKLLGASSSSSPIKKYTKLYPDWEVPTKSDASLYWQWTFYRFRQDIATYYSGTVPKYIPLSWHNISRDTAMRSLNIYDCEQ